MVTPFIIFYILFMLRGANTEQGEYYWKEYTGTIPPDALPGGKDFSGRDTFIGQAYIHQHGIYIAQIFPEKTEVDAPWRGIKTAKKDIKILCTEYPEFFEWLPTSQLHFHVNTTRLQPVPGGYDFVGDDGLSYIGRLKYQGIVKIGGIWSSQIENARFYFEGNNGLKESTLYEALIYRGIPEYHIDPRMMPE